MTSRFSAFRRSRVDRWSSRYSLVSRRVFCSSRSSSSTRDSWRRTRFWVRCATLANIWLTLRRVTTCRSSSRAAVAWTRLNATASSPTSSPDDTSIAASRGGCSSTRSTSVTRTSSSLARSATVAAARVRRCNGLAIDRLMVTASAMTRAKSTDAPTPTVHAATRALPARRAAAAAIWLVTRSWTSRRNPAWASTVASAWPTNAWTELRSPGLGRRWTSASARRAASPWSTSTTSAAWSTSACWTNRSVNICDCADAVASRSRPTCGLTAVATSAMPRNALSSFARSSASSAVSCLVPSASLVRWGTSRNASISAPITAWYARATLSSAAPRRRALWRSSASEPNRTSALVSSSDAGPSDRRRASAVTSRSRCSSQTSAPSCRALRAASAVVVDDCAFWIWPKTNGMATSTTAASGSRSSRFSFPRTRSLLMIIAVLPLHDAYHATRGYQLRREQLAGVDKLGDALRTVRLGVLALGRVAMPAFGLLDRCFGGDGRRRRRPRYPQPQQRYGGQHDDHAGQHQDPALHRVPPGVRAELGVEGVEHRGAERQRRRLRPVAHRVDTVARTAARHVKAGRGLAQLIHGGGELVE